MTLSRQFCCIQINHYLLVLADRQAELAPAQADGQSCRDYLHFGDYSWIRLTYTNYFNAVSFAPLSQPSRLEASRILRGRRQKEQNNANYNQSRQ